MVAATKPFTAFRASEDDESRCGLDPYEREKVETTIADLERAASSLRLYLDYRDKIDEHRIVINTVELPDMAALRVPGGPAGPDSDVFKIGSMASKCMEKIRRQLPPGIHDLVVYGAEAVHKSRNR